MLAVGRRGEYRIRREEGGKGYRCKTGYVFWVAAVTAFLMVILLFGNSPIRAGTVQVSQPSDSAQETRLENMLANLPLIFIENQGQLDKEVLYYAEGKNQALYFTPQGLTFSLIKSEKQALNDTPGEKKTDASSADSECWAVKLDFIGAAPGIIPQGENETETTVSYFKGRRADWRTGLKTYSHIAYRNLWPGIDLVFKGDSRSLKYEFVVHPGADPAQIRLAWQGAGAVEINQQGHMEIKTPLGGFTDQSPIAWQEIDREQKNVHVSYQLQQSAENSWEWGFKLGSYNPLHQLVIDPAILDYCGYIGGSGWDEGFDIAVDSLGRAYVTGYTDSVDFPLAGGAGNSYKGKRDAFAARVNADGSALDYCCYIGGSERDKGYGIAVDSRNRAYLTGNTSSSDFPVTPGCLNNSNKGKFDVFVVRINDEGTDLDYCGYIGGSEDDAGLGIAVDSSNRAYLTGNTGSSDFPATPGCLNSYSGGGDAFVARVVYDGSSLEYCVYIGGSYNDCGFDIAVDSSNRAYVAGKTYSNKKRGFPVKVGPSLVFQGKDEAYVARVAHDGSSLDYCGYIGGSEIDVAWGIAVDNSNRAYVTGVTSSSKAQGFPARMGPDVNYTGKDDAFVARVVYDGSSLDYCGYIGGSENDRAYGIAIDSSNCAYVTGRTSSSKKQGFPVTKEPDSSYNGGGDAFVARVAADGSSLKYCGYIGGSKFDKGNGIAVDSSNRAYVTGSTESYETEGFPVLKGPGLTYNKTGNDILRKRDAFVARVTPEESTEKDIIAFTLYEQTREAMIDNTTHTVGAEVYRKTDLSRLIPAIIVSDGASITPASGVVQNFSSPVPYTVTAEDGTVQEWTVNVSAVKSSANDILNFILPEQTGPAKINSATHTINIEAAPGTDLDSLTPTISISDGASITPASGAAQDYRSPVTYTVTAEDGTVQEWTVTVVKESEAGQLHFSNASYSVSEGSGSIIITVERTGGSEGAVSVDYKIGGGTAIEGTDYTAASYSGTLNFENGEKKRTFDIKIIDDGIAENNKTVNLTLSNAGGGAVLTVPSEAVLTILDDDSPLEIAGTEPYDGETGVAVNKTAVVTFNKNVTQSVYFTDISFAAAPDFTVVDFVYAIKGNILTLNPSSELNYLTTYTLEIPEGAVEGTDGSLLGTGKVINFCTTVRLTSGGSRSNSTYSPVNSTTGFASVIPSTGGTVGLDDDASLIIPGGALRGTAGVEVTVQKVDNPPAAPTGFRFLGEVYEFRVNGSNHYNFNKPVTLTFTFDPDDLAPGEKPEVFYYDETIGEWVSLGGTVSGNTITITVTHFTKFAVMVKEKPLEEKEQSPEPESSVTLTDIIGHWAEPSIKQLTASGAIKGYPDGTFKPDKTITRAEFVTVLVKAFNLELKGGKEFKDTADHWAKDYITAASAAGIINGYDENTFGPDDLITREQMAVMTVKAAKVDKPAGNCDFADNSKISAWARDAVAAATAKNIISGYPDNTFRPQQNATRAEAVAVIVRALSSLNFSN